MQQATALTRSTETSQTRLVDKRLRLFFRKALFLVNSGLSVPLFESLTRGISRNLAVVITCQRTDGGGAQLHGRISAMTFASRFGFVYKSQRIRGAHFASGDTWDDQWNALLDIQDQVLASDETIVKVNGRWGFCWALMKHRLERKPTPIVIEIEAAHWYTDFRPQLLERFAIGLRPSFRPPAPLHGEPLVIHLRRGEDLTAQVRFQSDVEVLQVLHGLRVSFGEQAVRIYTNAPASPSLSQNLPESVKIDFETDPFRAIAHMSAAEGLVIAKSSMSYVAAMMSEGTIFYPEFWHPKLPNWNALTDLQRDATRVAS